MVYNKQRFLKQIYDIIMQQKIYFFILSILSGLIGGVVVQLLNIISLLLHRILFHLPPHHRLSALSWVNPWYCLLIPVLGGVGLWGVRKVFSPLFNKKIVDIIEANALHGGKLSIKDSFYIAIQTIFSNGFGISLGLESAYTQVSSAFASKLGRIFQVEQNKLRLLVGCGAAGAIGAAFDSVLGGAFYGFEIVLASYNFANFPYVILASMVGFMMVHWLGGAGPSFHVIPTAIYWFDYGLVSIFSLLCACVSILVMYSVTKIEIYLQQFKVDKLTALIIGALIVGVMGTITPAVLGSGHGALWLVLQGNIGFKLACVLFIFKAIASSISLGVGFRGGLFFASMLLGGTAGIIYGNVLILIGIHSLSPLLYAVIGMAVVSASIIGGPLCMMFLALDMANSYQTANIVLLAIIVAVVMVRKTFGYSFATWRFHLRGENLRSALDVSQLKLTTAEILMKPVIDSLDSKTTIAQALQYLQSNHNDWLVLRDNNNEYKGLVEVIRLLDDKFNSQDKLEQFIIRKNRVLTPGMNIKEIMDSFNDIYKCPWMVVVRGIDNYKILGIVQKEEVLNHYSEILEKQINDITGTKLYNK